MINLLLKICVAAFAIFSGNAAQQAQRETSLLPENPKELRVLTFGHSFTQDNKEYIDDLLNADGIKIPGKDLYVVMADRWMPQTLKTDLPAQQFDSFKARYAKHTLARRVEARRL